MAIVRWNPWLDMDQFDRFFESPASSFVPAMDVYEDKDNVYVESPLAGVDPHKVNITIEDNVLKIEGSTEKKSEVDEKNYYRKEVRSGGFYRTVALPSHVQADKAEANFSNGMLKITVPKTEEVKPKKIPLKISTS
ncbi:MAG: Hsp20/alpha crystallin family protein [Patescibacteria group bacterium]